MWATSMGGSAQDQVTDVAVHTNGTVAVVGSYYSAAFAAGAGSLQNFQRFVVQYDFDQLGSFVTEYRNFEHQGYLRYSILKSSGQRYYP